jgi:hypothetical protein
MTDRVTQIKFTIESDIVAAFKANCMAGGVSMTSVVCQWMRTRQPAKGAEPKPLTRPKRRIAVMKIIALLNEILTMEEQYRDSIPEQFTQRFEWSEHACDHLAEAIDNLRDAFAP